MKLQLRLCIGIIEFQSKIQSNSINRRIGNLPALFAAALAALWPLCVPGYPKAGLRCMVPISKSAVADVYS